MTAPKLGEVVELEPTKLGFRCWYGFHEGGLVVYVLERLAHFDKKTGSHTSFWFAHANVSAVFGVSRERARAIVEHFTDFFDGELAGTLGPMWAAWDALPEEDPQAERPGLVTGVPNAVH